MTLEDIHEKTLSKGITTANAVYRVVRDTIGVEIHTGAVVEIPEGSLMAISGCGWLKNGGRSYFQYMDTWVWLYNHAVEHYANRRLNNATLRQSVFIWDCLDLHHVGRGFRPI